VPRGGALHYGFADLAVVRQVSAALGAGRSFRGIVRDLLADSRGQLLLDFQAGPAPAKVIQLTARPAPATPPVETRSATAVSPRGTAHPDVERLFLEASALDDGDPNRLEEVAARYRDVLRRDPSLVPALINLGNVHYTRGALIEAQALYERAINIGPEYFEAHFNLANVLHDLDCLDEACLSYRDALSINPGCAEAHFYLAVTLEKLGRSPDARPHWRAYLETAPAGEWVDLAREFSE
jgi:tetratricopeptide (TPR) repeat protein